MKTFILAILVLIAGVAGGYYYGQGKFALPVKTESKTIPVADKARIDAVNSLIAGRWQSEEDSNFVREFKADGTAIDYYDEQPAPSQTNGSWKLFSSSNPEQVAFPIRENEVYLKMTFGKENYHFAVLAVTPEKLELMYMERGGILQFARLK